MSGGETSEGLGRPTDQHLTQPGECGQETKVSFLKDEQKLVRIAERKGGQSRETSQDTAVRIDRWGGGAVVDDGRLEMRKKSHVNSCFSGLNVHMSHLDFRSGGER